MNNLFRWSTLINASLFQATWFACVLGSAKGLLWPAFACCAALASYQLHNKRRVESDLQLVALSVLLGLMVDTLWLQLGFLQFTDPRPVTAMSPAWIMLLWVGFALTINHSLSWINAHPLLPAVLGGIGGPLSYLAGERLGAVTFTTNVTALMIYIGIAWAISLTLLALVAKDKQN
ncbi:DUF2878 domain-containing protein [Arenicella xantha]|uniref:Uncharacterized protein DUF2878 n=1 Tax=Arenicella xantha TaxID=644221 RepID=A0A395JK63_9GAMM|nr:DUF2878 domain-containing protein [Arenicella xantha]RBP50805.1 uncharacterized protein DUF2878 [Arenicella xantha]